MYQHIMVPVDGSKLAECVLPHLEVFIKDYHVKNVVLVQVVEPLLTAVTVEFSPSAQELERREADMKFSATKYLDQVTTRLKHEGTTLDSKILYGRVAEEIVDYAENNNIDLILVATHGRSGISRWVRGSVTDKILRAANVPVLIVRAPGTRRAL